MCSQSCTLTRSIGYYGTMVVVCPLCSSFAAKDQKGVLRHMGVVHAHEAGFYVRCCVEDCPCTYSNFHSYKKHLYTKHRAVLEVSPSIPVRADEAATIDFDTSPSSTECFDDCPMDSIEGRKRTAALFVLKAKHIHKVSQSSLSDVMCDISTMLESTVQHVEKDVMAELGDIDPDIEARLHLIFHSQQVCDPFCGLQTEQRQKTAFKEQFHLLVCYVL